MSLTSRGTELITAARQIVAALDEHVLAPFGGRSSDDTARLHDQLLTLLHHLDQEKPS